MKSESMNKPFSINQGEQVLISNVDFNIKLKNLSRLMLPKGPDQFLIMFVLEWNHCVEEVGLDGDFSFTDRIVKVDWKKFRIQIHDIDRMARFAVISIQEI